MNLVRFEQCPPDWDQRISGFATKTLFHETAWHKHLLHCSPGSRMEYYAFIENTTEVGYFCAHRVRKAMLPIMGSPMPGTGTNYMGPLVRTNSDQRDILAAIVAMCRRSRVAHLELCNDWLAPDSMRDLGFEAHGSWTHAIELAVDQEGAWQALHSTCRNRVRKAERAGLTVEFSSDPAVADIYYDQFTEVYGKQGMATPYDRSRPRSLVASLLPARRLLAAVVKQQDGTAVASGLFPYDEKCIYYWGGASWLSAHALCPNELLHWSVIKFAIANGIPRYDMCGGGSQFKRKFGGGDVPHIRYTRSFIPFVAHGRRLYAAWHFGRLRLKGFLHNPFGPRKARVG